jgi:hypothetical protein
MQAPAIAARLAEAGMVGARGVNGMHRIILGFALLAVAGCTASTSTGEPQLGTREAKALEKAIAGKVAGQPVSCIAAFDSTNLRSLGDHVLIYEAGRNLVWVNRVQGVCRGLAQGDTLVMNRTSSSQYCRGDIARVVHLPSGAMSGSCALGDFVPYRTPEQ